MARNLLISAQTENIEAIYVAVDQNGRGRMRVYPTSASGVYCDTYQSTQTRAMGPGGAKYFVDGGFYHRGAHIYIDFDGQTVQIPDTDNNNNGESYTGYPASDDHGTLDMYVVKDVFELNTQYFAVYPPVEGVSDSWDWDSTSPIIQYHMKKYGRDGKVLSSIFPGVSYDGESVTYNPTREPYSVGDYSGETWVERFSAYTEYLPTNAVGGVDANGAYVTSLDNPSVKNPSAVPGNEDWHFIFGDGPVFYIPKGTKKVIFAYPLPDPVA